MQLPRCLVGIIEADALLADKGCDADARVLGWLGMAEIEPVIPAKPNRKEPRIFDKALCKARHLIETVFEILKHYKAMATCHDETATAFPGAIHLAAPVIRLD